MLLSHYSHFFRDYTQARIVDTSVRVSKSDVTDLGENDYGFATIGERIALLFGAGVTPYSPDWLATHFFNRHFESDTKADEILFSSFFTSVGTQLFMRLLAVLERAAFDAIASR